MSASCWRSGSLALGSCSAASVVLAGFWSAFRKRAGMPHGRNAMHSSSRHAWQECPLAAVSLLLAWCIGAESVTIKGRIHRKLDGASRLPAFREKTGMSRHDRKTHSRHRKERGNDIKKNRKIYPKKCVFSSFLLDILLEMWYNISSENRRGASLATD